jgi:FkbM family methyltransferase
MSDLNRIDDAAFRHYTLKHRVIAWVSMHLLDGVTYTVRHGLLKGMKRKGGLGWIPPVFASRPSAEQEFWSALNLAGMIVYDIGAFHGLLTLLFASRAKAVISFEPNTRNHARLMQNLALNHVSNVDVRKVGVGSRSGAVRMAANPLLPGAASVDVRAVEDLLQTTPGTVVEHIPIVTLDEEITAGRLPPPDFVKIDIEGWEIEALRGARETLRLYRPQLFLEMHGSTIGEKKRKVEEIVAFLWALQYRGIRHIETGTMITPATAAVAMEGHLYCRPA